ncbi:pentatricopeptide repeat-containing protein [Striga asiatica]|uniref:Pentatricopeptide repeat-containing protein n=1 Tax=Striga asiatica TaxID=4170 RepID=A0A5A7PQS4_STRAF|nr:pentatricopeptide repeat-containing protein [Striga asiatica]
MRRPVLISSHQSIIFTRIFLPSTQKLLFSATSNGENIKNHRLAAALPDPANITSLDGTKSFHALVTTMGSFPNQEPVFLHNNIISKYASLDKIDMARKVFDKMPQTNAVSYNTMIACYGRAGLIHESLKLFSAMRKCDFEPTQFTFGGLLSCHELGVFEGKQLHGLMEKTGALYVDGFAGTALLGMYRRHSCLDECVKIFESMPVKTSVTWNNMISVFGQMGYIKDCIFMLSELMMEPSRVSELTFVNVLSSLDEVSVQLGEQTHSLVMKYGFDNTASVCNCLINMYAKCGAICSAEKMFNYTRVKDIVTWNTLIGAVANGDSPDRALNFFRKMCVSGFLPNGATFANLLSSCSRLKNLSYGKCIHAKVIEHGFESDVYNGTALVTFYAKCNQIREAHACFEAIECKNSVSWNSLMLGYSKSGFSSVGLLHEMIRSGFYPNAFSFSIVIKSSSKRELPQLHSLTTKTGYDKNPYVSSCLISSYAKNDMVSDALVFVGSDTSKLSVVCSNILAWIYNRTGQYDRTQELYASMNNPDSMSWNILIAACSRNGDYKETFELFDHMRRSKIYPDNYTFSSLFSVCTSLCNLALGKSLHSLLVKTDFKKCDILVCNIMIDMYGKCGCVKSSITIFDEMGEKNIISWTALVSSLGLHGYANEALGRFKEMVEFGIKPDRVAFLAILSACRHVGLVDEGMELFGEMKVKFDVEPDIDHYLVAIDLLTRHGRIKEAEQLILGMPMAPNAQIWRSFLDGCKRQTSMENLVIRPVKESSGARAFNQLLK